VRGTSERSAGLPLEYLLALETRLTGPDRRMLASAAETLRTMPHLTAAFQAGLVGWAEVRPSSVRSAPCPSTPGRRSTRGSPNRTTSSGRDADRLLDEVRAMAASLRPDKADKDTAGTSSGASSTSNPSSAGPGGTGYFELDDEGFATVAAGLEAAMPAPSAGPNDVTTDAIGHADDDGDG
jgi:hypothetical protein